MNLNQPVIEATTIDNILGNDGIVIGWLLGIAIVVVALAIWKLLEKK